MEIITWDPLLLLDIYLIELIEYFLILQHVGWDEDVHDGVGGPEGHGQHADSEVDLVSLLDVVLAAEVAHVLLESHVDIPGELHVLEHTLQLACETRPERKVSYKNNNF